MDRRGLMRRESVSRLQVCSAALGRSRYRGRQFYYLPGTNKVGKSRDGRKKKEGKTFRRAASAKEIVRSPTSGSAPDRCDAMCNWIGTLSSFPYFRIPPAVDEQRPPWCARDRRRRICFSNFRSFARGQPTTVAVDQWVSNLALVSHLTAPRLENATFLRVTVSRNLPRLLDENIKELRNFNGGKVYLLKI